MLRDQATELRNLVRRAGRTSTRGPCPTLVCVAAGNAGLGATTVAIEVAAGLAHLGLRIVLADGNFHRPAVAARCGIGDSAMVKGGLADLLSARRDLHEVLIAGHCGLQILPGLPPLHQPPDFSASACDRLVNQFRTLGRHVDGLFVDVGSEPSDLMRSLWHASDHVLLVTSPDDRALIDTYAMIKTIGVLKSTSLHLLVNRCASGLDGDETFARLAQSCQRFLGVELRPAGWIPIDGGLECGPRSTRGSDPSASTPTAGQRAFERLAGQWQIILENRPIPAAHAG